MLILNVLFVTTLFQNLNTVECYSYCQKQEQILCQDRKHIVCHPEQIEPIGKFKKLIPMTNRLKRWILYWHNNYRSQAACGTIRGENGRKLPKASRMRELVWDYELAYIARIHVQRCKMQHDACRKTKRIPVSGQNLAVLRTNDALPKTMDVIHSFITKWFNEGKSVDKDLLHGDFFEGMPFTRDIIGHFTLMVQDRVRRVGCAMSYCKKNMTNYNYLTCNYDYSNVKGEPVYTFGNWTSDCEFWDVGKSANFSCLCANRNWRRFLPFSD